MCRIEEGLFIIRKLRRSYDYLPQFQMELFSPDTWSVLATFEFDKEERVLSAKICNLNIKQNDKTVSQAFLAVGTAYVRGEDLGSQGRIMVFDVLRPRDVTQSKFELLFEKSERGPISCVTQDGLLLCAIGMKILLFQFEDRKSLVGVAFFDCQILIVDAVSIKNYVILGDMYKSIYFLKDGFLPLKQQIPYLNPFGFNPATCCNVLTILISNLPNFSNFSLSIGAIYPAPPSRVV